MKIESDFQIFIHENTFENIIPKVVTVTVNVLPPKSYDYSYHLTFTHQAIIQIDQWDPPKVATLQLLLKPDTINNVHPSAIIMWSNLSQYYIQHFDNSSRIWIRY